MIIPRSLGSLLLSLCLIALGGCGGGGSSSITTTQDETDVTVYAYVATSSYAAVLPTCAMAETSRQSCRLSTLPLLLEDTTQPTVDDIMARVTVSHDWMGLRLRELLEIMPGEMLQLFQSVTAIVIDDDVRPSYYSPTTGTIYLDPAYLWLSIAEKNTIDTTPDYRSEFDNALQFTSVYRYVMGNDYAWDYYDLSSTEARGLFDIHLNFARLMIHELMHANDAFPPLHAPYLSQNQTLYQAYRALETQRISRTLAMQYPLQSATMYALADVMFNGQQATVQQQNLSADDVATLFDGDRANDDYAYASFEEDAAMLFEEVLMLYLFNVARDIAYIDASPANVDCTNAFISWGVRGRIGDPDVKERAQFIFNEVFIDQDFSLFFQNLPAPQLMQAGDNWCDNVAL